ncbi:hypothetical protein GQR58_024928 [Nymphon striatum]|nr:hypothetical protein GQR58_024928 [Nymphon striatum]
MYDYRVTCSYDELLRFKKSAAVAAAGDLTQQGISDSTSELVQVSDMAIETTFMRYGYSKSGIVGITLKPETLKTWAYSLHTCHGILDDLDEMRETYRSPCKTTHKEETAARIQGNEQVRKNLHEKLKLCIDPLDLDQPSDGLVNIVTGQIVTHSAVNVDMSLKLI